MVFRVIFEDEFVGKIDRIIAYNLIKYSNETYAKKLIDFLYMKVVPVLQVYPYMYPRIGNGTVRKIILKDFSYNLYYSVDETNKVIYLFDIRSSKEK